LADAAEAVLGALYLDGGFDRAFDVISRFCRSRESLFFRESRNPKTLLQELLESRGRTRPEYYLVKTEGPDHEPLHTVKVIIDGKTMATAVGKTIREAENRAAEKLLMDLNATDCI
jgi:ribonuclease-3